MFRPPGLAILTVALILICSVLAFGTLERHPAPTAGPVIQYDMIDSNSGIPGDYAANSAVQPAVPDPVPDSPDSPASVVSNDDLLVVAPYVDSTAVACSGCMGGAPDMRGSCRDTMKTRGYRLDLSRC